MYYYNVFIYFFVFILHFFPPYKCVIAIFPLVFIIFIIVYVLYSMQLNRARIQSLRG